MTRPENYKEAYEAEENNRLEEMGLRSGWSRTRIIREALHRYLEAEEGE